MRLRFGILVVAAGLLGLGGLTVVQVPDWGPWKAAVLAGEFGHWFAVLAAAVLVLTLRKSTVGQTKRERVVRAMTVAMGGGAAVLFLVPVVQAWRIARDLPARLEAQFGKVEIERLAFSAVGLVGPGVDPVPVETIEMARGLPMDLYRAVRDDGRPAPAVIVVHGGGWEGGDRKQLPELNHRLARRGYAVVAVSYRFAPQHIWPAQQRDVEAAIAIVKMRAAEFGIDPTRLVLLGRSAGGQIAEVVGYTANDPAIRGVVALYAPSDLLFGYVNTHENDMLKSPALMRRLLGGSPETARANFEAASALNFVSPRSPPTLLLHGRNDALAWHRHSERLEARLKEQGAPCVYVALPWATHAFDYTLRGPGGQLTWFSVEWFVAAVTR